MRKLTAFVGAAALGLSAQAAFGYGGSATLTFTFGGSASGASADQGFVSSAGPIAVSSMTNGTYFSTLGGANSLGTYNSDFATDVQCAPGGGLVPGGYFSSTRKYGCRFGTTSPNIAEIPIPVVDGGPVGQASGILTVTDTTLTGTLTLLSTTDEPTGATTVFAVGATGTTRISNSVGDGLDGYNYRTADGSPFGNAWYGATTAGTFTVNLTGTFTALAWNITGGSVTYSDAGFACQQGGFGGDSRGTLCSSSGTGGGFNPDGSHLSWGIDVDGAGTGSTSASAITVYDAGGANVIATLAGAIASLTLDGAGNITGGTGEFRRASGSAGGGCLSSIRYDGTNLTCGSLTAGNLSITGSVAVVPVPAAVWLMGSALGLLGWIRRKASA